MWLRTNEGQKVCGDLRDALENGVETGLTLQELLAPLPDAVQVHFHACNDCRVFAAELLEIRHLLRAAPDGPLPGPYFLGRVMASIADQETVLEEKSRTWAAVPRLASRLTLLASLTLVIAGGWLYERPAARLPIVTNSADQPSEGLVDGSSTTIQDDLLVNVAGN